jgi:hypothetical protein
LVVARTKSGWHSAVPYCLTRDSVRRVRINQPDAFSLAKVMYLHYIQGLYSYSFDHLKPKEYGLKVLGKRTLSTRETEAVDKSIKIFLRVQRISLLFVLYMHAQDRRWLIKSADFVLNALSEYPIYDKLDPHLDSLTQPPLFGTHHSPKCRPITYPTPPPTAQTKTAPSLSALLNPARSRIPTLSRRKRYIHRALRPLSSSTSFKD